MAGRVCCAEDDRSESPVLPNARSSPLRNHLPSQNKLTLYQPLSTESQFTSVRTTDLNELHEIFENATADTNDPNITSTYDLKNLYGSPRKAPSPPQRTATQKLRRKLSRGSTFSDLTRLATRKQKRKSNEASGQSASLAAQKDHLRVHLLSEKTAKEGGYDQDARELQVPDEESPRTGQTISHSIDGQASENAYHPMLHSFEWIGPLLTEGQRRSNGNSGSLTVPTALGKLLSLPSLRPYASVPNLLGASGDVDCARIRASSRSSTIVKSQLEDDLCATNRNLVIPKSQTRAFSSDPGIGDSYEAHRQAKYCKKNHVAAPAKEVQGQHHNSKRGTTSGRLCLKVDSEMQTHGGMASCSEQTLSSDVDDTSLVRCPTGGSNGTSMHLQNMQISRRLRSSSNVSNTTSFLTRRTNKISQHSRSSSNYALTTGMQLELPIRRKVSNSGFSSAKVPLSWGKVNQGESSSVYSGRSPSPPVSQSLSTGLLSYKLSPQTPLPNAPRVTSPLASVRNDDSSSKASDQQEQVGDTVVKQQRQRATTGGSEASTDSKHTQISKASSSNLSRKSKFIEDMNGLTLEPMRARKIGQRPSRKKRSTFNIFQIYRRGTKALRRQVASFDGPSDVMDKPAKGQAQLTGTLDKPMEMWEKALQAHREEKSAMWLSPQDHRGDIASKRERRQSSVGRSRASSNAQSSHRPPAFITANEESIDPLASPTQRSRSLDPILVPPAAKRPKHPDRSRSYSFEGYRPICTHKRGSSNVSAWSRYPSHTRTQRCGSAGPEDNVFPRDFALYTFDEAGETVSESASSVKTKRDSKRIRFGIRRNKGEKYPHRRGRGALPRSQSLTFGRAILKHYASFFMPQSHEFFQHGHGHRSSISTGGRLESPELEIIRPVLPSYSTKSPIADPAPVSGVDEADIEMRTLSSRRASVANWKGKGKQIGGDGACESAEAINYRGVDIDFWKNSQVEDDSGPYRTSFIPGSHHQTRGEPPVSKAKGKRRLRNSSSQSDQPVAPKRTISKRQRVDSIDQAWCKLYDDCVQRSPASSGTKDSCHQLQPQREAGSPSKDGTTQRDIAIYTDQRDAEQEMSSPAKRDDTSAYSIGFDIGRGTLSVPRTRSKKPKRPALQELMQGGAFSPIESDQFGELPEKVALKEPSHTLSSSASAPVLGKSEVSFFAALRKNESEERARVLQLAERLVD
ncbi:MAG: hypothetical protein M1820_006456 [Bogoriella megaspora]|nr:MAG: hypothetical protein M1820_006456 [Bogoriella megaspora]